MDEPTFTLGAIQSPPDPRDFPVSAAYEAAGLTPALAIPVTYVVPGLLPPVLNQSTKPECVAYSSAAMKSYEDRIDQGQFFSFDEDRFFVSIGGGPNGAVIRNAFDQMLKQGYPLMGGVSASLHRIAAYYAVPVDKTSIQQALMAFGPVVLGMNWFNSWFRPNSIGILPYPDSVIGGHAIMAIGWDWRGLRLRNSWGSQWGVYGDCYLPWAYLPKAWECWKAIDVIDTPPVPATNTFVIGPGVRVLYIASVTADRPPKIGGWRTTPWSGLASTAPCRPPAGTDPADPFRLYGTSSGSALVAYITAGASNIVGTYVRVDASVGTSIR